MSESIIHINQFNENEISTYNNCKENIITKINILGNRIEKILELDEHKLNNEESTLLLFESVKLIYHELLVLKEDINILKLYKNEENNMNA